MIKEIRQYLKEKGKASLDEISFYLKINREMVRHALYLLEDKDLILVEEVKSPCQGCSLSRSCQGFCSELNVLYSLK